jgi:vacuolar-type H+-ATPase subunit I/STV1
MARRPTTLRTIINELVDRTNTDTQRIRILEQREGGLSNRTESIEQEVLNINKSLQKLIVNIDTGLKKRDKSITEMQATIKEMIKHLKKLASVSKVNELEAMLNIYNPLKSNFVTKEEVEQLISQKLSSMSKNNK